MLFRALIRTHHATSRKKIRAITQAAKKYECAVYLKTGSHPPAMMIAESEIEGKEGLAGWVATVKNLRYKDFQHVRSEQVQAGRLDVAFGSVKELDHMRTLAADLTDCGVAPWWEDAMGFSKVEK